MERYWALERELRGLQQTPPATKARRTGRQREPDSAHERVAKVLRNAPGRPHTYEDLARHPMTKGIRGLRQAMGKARKAYPQIIQGRDADGFATYTWDARRGQ